MKCLLSFEAPHWEWVFLLLAIMQAFDNRSNHSYATIYVGSF